MIHQGAIVNEMAGPAKGPPSCATRLSSKMALVMVSDIGTPAETNVAQAVASGVYVSSVVKTRSSLGAEGVEKTKK